MGNKYTITRKSLDEEEFDFQEARDKCPFGKCEIKRCNLFLNEPEVNGDYTKCSAYISVSRPLN